MSAYVFNPFTGNLDVVDDGAPGDVLGPASSVDESVTVYDGTTGKKIKDSASGTYNVKIVNGRLIPTDTANPDSIVIGEAAIASYTTGVNPIVIGARATGGVSGILIGHDAVGGTNTIQIGSSTVSSSSGIAIGNSSDCSGSFAAAAIGDSAAATTLGSYAVGRGTTVSGSYAGALGFSNTISGSSSNAFGAFCNDNGFSNSLLVGTFAVATENGEIIFRGNKAIILSIEGTPTTNPAEGNKFYFKSDDNMYSLSTTGVEKIISAQDHIDVVTGNPHVVTFTESVTADSGTDISAAEAETLTDGSDADALHIHAIADTHIASTSNPHSVTLEQARTAGQVMTGQFEVDATSDVVKQIIRAHATQSANLFESYDAASALSAHINAAGDFTNPDPLYSGSERFGAGASITNTGGTAIGTNSEANTQSTAIGNGARATGNPQSIAIGAQTLNAYPNSILIGDSGTTTSGNNSMAIGPSASAGASCVAIGDNSSGGTNLGLAVGYQSSCPGAISTALGALASCTGSFALAIGAAATSSGPSSVAMGFGATAAASGSFAMGNSANVAASHNGSMAIGAGTVTTAAGQLILGAASPGNGFNTAYFNGVTRTTVKDLVLNMVGGSGTNINGSSLTIAGGKGTGTGVGGYVAFSTAPAGTSGTSLNTLIERLRFKETIEAVFNDTGANYDLRVEGATDSNLLHVDASADTVQIGSATASDSAKFYVSGKISTSGELEINGDLNHDGTNVGFYNTTPISQPANTVAINDILVNLGLRASGAYSNFTTTLQPRAGTTAANTAPIKLTDGPAMTTPEEGAIEYDDGHLYFTQKSRMAIALANGVKTTTTTVTNTVTETEIYSYTFAADQLNTDQVIEFKMNGIVSNASASDDYTIRMKVGGTTVHTVSRVGGNVTNEGWGIEYSGTIRTNGVSGTFIDFSKWFEGTLTDAQGEITTHSVDTTSAVTFQVTVQWGNPKAGNSFSCTQGRLIFLH